MGLYNNLGTVARGRGISRGQGKEDQGGTKRASKKAPHDKIAA